uniref:Uncharacterized protein n=1 Tax=Oncorhynchus mykiss TaxID=8022 RepID=A0A8K9V1B4_ONCMY
MFYKIVCDNPNQAANLMVELPLSRTLTRKLIRNPAFSVNRGMDGNPKMVTSFTSPLEACLLFHNGGHWREQATPHPQRLTPEEIEVHKSFLVEYFTKGPGALCQLDSLYFQERFTSRCSHEESPYKLPHVLPHIQQEVMNRMQYSTQYINMHSVKKATVRECNPCFGFVYLVIVEQGLTFPNQLIMEVPGYSSDICPLTAVVNPARAGPHYRVIRALRNPSSTRRLLYISCKPEGEPMRNFRELWEAFSLTVTVPR